MPLLLTLTLLFFPSDKEMPLPSISTLFPSFDKEIIPVILMPLLLTLNSLVAPLLILILPCPPIVTLPSQSTEKLFVLPIHNG